MDLRHPFIFQGEKKVEWVGALLILLSAALYYVLLYHIPRENFYPFIGIYAALFGFYIYYVYPLWKSEGSAANVNFSQNVIGYILGAAILFRLIATIALPPFSDDYFRFIWDGKLIVEGISPFLQLPVDYAKDPVFMRQIGIGEELLAGMNSPEYFTIYPPVLQAIFALGAAMSPDNIYGAVLVMKLFVFVAEVGSLLLIRRILKKLELPEVNLIYYALNPLVIVELCGNLHFEALMIFYLLSAWYLLLQDEWWKSALAFAMAVCSKLLPLMLLPFLLRRLGWGKTIAYGAIVGLMTLFLFFPILGLDTFANLRESVKLYFYSFEFNASIWYIVREIGYQIEGYNIIKLAGDYFSRVAAVLILILAFTEKKPVWRGLGKSWLWAFMIYFAFATIVHPWYITTLLALSLFSVYRFPLIWTIFLPLTYYTYRTDAYEENLWLLAIEYLVVFVYMFYEIKQKAKQSSF
ncbi:MAG: hypothetical protein AAFR87_13665 [Bacteroidota bacterium]